MYWIVVALAPTSFFDAVVVMPPRNESSKQCDLTKVRADTGPELVAVVMKRVKRCLEAKQEIEHRL